MVGPMYGRMDGPMDRPSYRDAWTHQKMWPTFQWPKKRKKRRSPHLFGAQFLVDLQKFGDGLFLLFEPLKLTYLILSI